MYSYEDRVRAVELYLKLGKRIKATIRQLGSHADFWGIQLSRVLIHNWVLHRTRVPEDHPILDAAKHCTRCHLMIRSS